MTHDIFIVKNIVKTRTNKQKQTDVVLKVNNGYGLNNYYSKKVASTKSGSDRIGPDRTG